jgi:hypothetical protein
MLRMLAQKNWTAAKAISIHMKRPPKHNMDITWNPHWFAKPGFGHRGVCSLNAGQM